MTILCNSQGYSNVLSTFYDLLQASYLSRDCSTHNHVVLKSSEDYRLQSWQMAQSDNMCPYASSQIGHTTCKRLGYGSYQSSGHYQSSSNVMVLCLFNTPFFISLMDQYIQNQLNKQSISLTEYSNNHSILLFFLHNIQASSPITIPLLFSLIHCTCTTARYDRELHS